MAEDPRGELRPPGRYRSLTVRCDCVLLRAVLVFLFVLRPEPSCRLLRGVSKVIPRDSLARPLARLVLVADGLVLRPERTDRELNVFCGISIAFEPSLRAAIVGNEGSAEDFLGESPSIGRDSLNVSSPIGKLFLAQLYIG